MCETKHWLRYVTQKVQPNFRLCHVNSCCAIQFYSNIEWDCYLYAALIKLNIHWNEVWMKIRKSIKNKSVRQLWNPCGNRIFVDNGKWIEKYRYALSWFTSSSVFSKNEMNLYPSVRVVSGYNSHTTRGTTIENLPKSESRKTFYMNIIFN